MQIDFDISDHWAEPILCGSQDDWSTNLKTILEWSPFATKMDLMQQVGWIIGADTIKLLFYFINLFCVKNRFRKLLYRFNSLLQTQSIDVLSEVLFYEKMP